MVGICKEMNYKIEEVLELPMNVFYSLVYARGQIGKREEWEINNKKAK